MQLVGVLPCLGLSRTSKNKEKEKCNWYRRSTKQYVAVFQCTTVHPSLPVNKGIDIKSGE
jgi:hypothetical protein